MAKRGLDWLLSFEDKLTGPAKEMLGAVGDLDVKLARLINTFASTEAAAGKVKLKSLGDEFAALQKTLKSGENVKAGGLFAQFEREQKALAAAGGVNATSVIEAQAKKFDQLRAAAKAANAETAKTFRAPATPLDLTAEGNRGRSRNGFARLVQTVGDTFGSSASEGLLSAGSALADVDAKLQSVGLSLGSVAAGFAAVGAAAVAAAGAAATFLVVKGSQMVLDAFAFKEQTLNAFTLITKSQQAAEAVYDRALRTADALGTNQRETLGQFNTLLAKGFAVDEIEKISKGLADLKAINPTANLQSITLAISQIRGKGRLQGEELMQLAEAGLSTSGVMEQVAKSMGKSTKEVEALLRGGKVTADQGIDAILKSIQATTGVELGGAAAARSRTLAGLMEQLSFANISDRILLNVDLGDGAKNVEGFLTNLNDLLKSDSAAASQLRATIGKGFGDLFTALFGDFAGADGAKKLEKIVLSVVSTIQSVIAGVTGFFSGFGGALADGLGLVGESLNEVDREKALRKLSADFAMLGSALGYTIVALVEVTKFFVNLASAASLAVQAILDPLNFVLGALDGLIPGFEAKGTSLGRAIANGMTFGIYGMIADIVAAGSAMGGAAEQGASQKLQIHSPSKVFDRLAGYTVDGFTNRIANDNGPANAVSSMLGSPAELAQEARAGAPAAAGGVGGSRVYYITINAPSGEPKAIRAEVADLLDELEASAA